jgi:hypothetical protein
VVLEPGAALPAAVRPKVPPAETALPAAVPAAVGPKVLPAETVEPAAELDDDCSGCRTAAGQGRQHLLLTEEMLEGSR